jgi:hypothetical protein
VLEEHLAVEVPEFSGAVPLGDSTVLLWSRSRPALVTVMASGRVLPPTALPAVPLSVAPPDSSGTFEMLDASGELYRLGRDGHVLSSHRLPLPGTLRAALSSGHGWWALSSDMYSGLRLTRYEDSTATQTVTLGMALSDSVLQLWDGGFHLVRGPSGLALLTARAPFELTLLSDTGQPTSTLRLDESPELAAYLRRSDLQAPTDFPADWRALPPTVVDSLLLLTIADVNSNRRLIALVHPTQGVRKVTEIEVPMALFAVGTQGELLGARRTDRFEFVSYTWKWATPTNQSRR